MDVRSTIGCLHLSSPKVMSLHFFKILFCRFSASNFDLQASPIGYRPVFARKIRIRGPKHPNLSTRIKKKNKNEIQKRKKQVPNFERRIVKNSKACLRPLRPSFCIDVYGARRATRSPSTGRWVLAIFGVACLSFVFVCFWLHFAWFQPMPWWRSCSPMAVLTLHSQVLTSTSSWYQQAQRITT